MRNPIPKVIFILTICCLLPINCSKKTASGGNHSDNFNKNFRYQLSRYKFSAVNDYVENNLSQINSRNLIDFYYEKMKMSYAAWKIALALQKYEFNKNFGKYEPGMVKTDELESTIRVFLLSSYLEAGDIQSFKSIIQTGSITTNNPLYKRLLVMNSIATGNEHAAIVQANPSIAYRYQSGQTSPAIAPEEMVPGGRSLDDLDQMIIAFRTGNEEILDVVFHHGAQTSLFYYQYISPQGHTVDIYDPHSLWLSFMYYGDKLLLLCEKSEDVSSTYSNYLSAMTYFLRGDKEQASLKLKNIIDSDQSLSATLLDISNALYQGILEMNHSVASEKIPKLETDLEKVKYCESLIQFSKNTDWKMIDDVFRDILNRRYKLINSLEGKYFILTESDTLCTDLEILYTIGRYYLLRDQINKAEECFLSVYQLYKSFSIKDNVNCGNLFEYDPALFIIYSSYAMLNNNNMVSIILQEITALSMGERIFLIPSRILSNVLTPPKIFGDNKLE